VDYLDLPDVYESQVITYIDDLIKQGKAYIVEVHECGGNFVCLDSSVITGMVDVSPKPIMYPVLFQYVRNEKDYPLWSPYKDGMMSPWGRGLVTVNLEYLKSIM
jgi:hypothetical protein